MASSEAQEQPQEGGKRYRGNCHCGAFVFEADFAAPITQAFSCVCSICTKKGYAWVAPRGELNVVRDEGLMDSYSFASKEFQHKFCGRCGTPVMGQSAKLGIRINARVLQDLDISKVEMNVLTKFAEVEPVYKPVPYTGPEPAAEVPNATMYHGSCHCGRVRIAVKLNGVLGETYTDRVWECNCSFCQRLASIWIYPKPDEVAIQGEDQLKYYSFGTGLFRKPFCGHCGVHLMNILLTDEEAAGLPAEARDLHALFKAKCMQPVTIRVLDGVDIRKVKSELKDGWNLAKPPYVNP